MGTKISVAKAHKEVARYLAQLRAAANDYPVLLTCPTTPERVANLLRVSLQSAYRKVKALEAAGLVTRHNVHVQGTPMGVHLTDEGAYILEHINETVEARARDARFEERKKEE